MNIRIFVPFVAEDMYNAVLLQDKGVVEIPDGTPDLAAEVTRQLKGRAWTTGDVDIVYLDSLEGALKELHLTL